MANLSILGSGFISEFYVQTLHGYRSKDKVIIGFSRNEENISDFCNRHQIPNWTTKMEEAVNHPEVEIKFVNSMSRSWNS